MDWPIDMCKAVCPLIFEDQSMHIWRPKYAHMEAKVCTYGRHIIII